MLSRNSNKMLKLFRENLNCNTINTIFLLSSKNSVTKKNLWQVLLTWPQQYYITNTSLWFRKIWNNMRRKIISDIFQGEFFELSNCEAVKMEYLHLMIVQLYALSNGSVRLLVSDFRVGQLLFGFFFCLLVFWLCEVTEKLTEVLQQGPRPVKAQCPVNPSCAHPCVTFSSRVASCFICNVTKMMLSLLFDICDCTLRHFYLTLGCFSLPFMFSLCYHTCMWTPQPG